MGLVSEVICGLTCASVDIITHTLNFFVDVDTYLHCIPYTGFKKAHNDCFGHYKETNKEFKESIKEDFKATKEIISEHKKNKCKKNKDEKGANVNPDGTIEAEFQEIPEITQKEFSVTNSEKVPTPKPISDLMEKYGLLYDTIKGDQPFNGIEIYRNNVVDIYTYESGQIFGSGINLIYTNNNSIIPISINQDPDIAEKFILAKDIILNQDDINRMISRMLPNYTLYKNFDMKGMHIDALSDEDKKILSDKLTAILGLYTADENGNLPRFRFTKFESVNRFNLKSDDKVNRPKKLIDLSLCSPLICNDSIKLDGGIITVKNDNKETKDYKIEYK